MFGYMIANIQESKRDVISRDSETCISGDEQCRANIFLIMLHIFNHEQVIHKHISNLLITKTLQMKADFFTNILQVMSYQKSYMAITLETTNPKMKFNLSFRILPTILKITRQNKLLEF